MHGVPNIASMDKSSPLTSLAPQRILRRDPSIPTVSTRCASGEMYAQQQPQQQLGYAPSPYSYTPSSNLAATINLDEVWLAKQTTMNGSMLRLFQEVKLADNSAERDLYESLAEIYSIITTLDALEKAYLRDSIKESEYTETCDRLLRQYKSNLADDSVHAAFGDLERFKTEWNVCTSTISTPAK